MPKENQEDGEAADTIKGGVAMEHGRRSAASNGAASGGVNRKGGRRACGGAGRDLRGGREVHREDAKRAKEDRGQAPD
jgi:hypothetical protein